MDPEVPLVVPEVNPEDIKWHKGIIANPNCSTIQAVVPLKPLHDRYVLKRVVYSTYQAVSGAGMGGYNDLLNGLKGESPKNSVTLLPVIVYRILMSLPKTAIQKKKLK